MFFIVLVAAVVAGVFFLSKGKGEIKEPIGDTENVVPVIEKKDPEDLSKKKEDKPPVPDKGDLEDKGEKKIIQPEPKSVESKATDKGQKEISKMEEAEVAEKKKVPDKSGESGKEKKESRSS